MYVFNGDELPENAEKKFNRINQMNEMWKGMFVYVCVNRVRVYIYLPISPLELDSVKLGVPSVHVGVEPSFDAGGVHANAPLDPYWLPLEVSTAKCGSNRISDMLFEE